jgi:hypothetical protein
MSFPAEYDFSAENVGLIELVELDTTEGIARFILNEDGFFTDINGHTWAGSKLISVSEVEYSINGSAPNVELSFSFIQDPDAVDLVTAVRTSGLASIKGRQATFYIQYMSALKEFYRPIFAPQKLTSREMLSLGYTFDGPQIRSLSLTVEGPFRLRSKPIGLRYNTADHSRRVGHANPSLEFMPTNSSDEQQLFGI